MASRPVRQIIRQWAALVAVPFYDTVSVDNDPADPVWFTVEWSWATRESTDYCQNEREDGAFYLVFFGQAGQGDDAVLAAAEAAAAVFKAQTDPKLHLGAINPPSDFTEGPWYGVEVEVEYSYDV